jgi:hypothetical protein
LRRPGARASSRGGNQKAGQRVFARDKVGNSAAAVEEQLKA